MLAREMRASARRTVQALLVAALLFGAVPVFAQTQPIQYGYDEVGRLVVVVDANGDAAIYEYDAMGNLLSIQRVDAALIPDPVAITYFTPSRGPVGTSVSIFGKGFSTTASQNTVSFNGGVGTVTTATPNRLIVTVPASAMTGPISVTTPLGSTTSSTTFRLLGPLTVSPSQAWVGPSNTYQFSVAGPGGFTPAVDWAVNGIPGGNATVGLISSAGLYTAPASVPQAMTVTVSASDHDDPSTAASALAIVAPAGTTLFMAANAVSVMFPARLAIVGGASTSVSAWVGANAVRSAATNVSAWVGGSPLATTMSRPVTASLAPVITAVSPSTVAAGTVDTSVTLTGAGFSDATAVTALLGMASDTTVTASISSVNPDGTQATILVTVATGASTGARVLEIVTPTGTSTAVNTGVNTLTVQ